LRTRMLRDATRCQSASATRLSGRPERNLLLHLGWEQQQLPSELETLTVSRERGGIAHPAGLGFKRAGREAGEAL